MPPLASTLLGSIEAALIEKLAPVLETATPNAGPCAAIEVATFQAPQQVQDIIKRYQHRGALCLLSTPSEAFGTIKASGLVKTPDSLAQFIVAGIFNQLDTIEDRNARLYTFRDLIVDNLADAIFDEADIPSTYKLGAVTLLTQTPLDIPEFSSLSFTFTVSIFGRRREVTP